MRLVSWNILAGGGSRCGAIVTRLERCDAHIIVLQETMTTRASDLCHALGRAGYAHRFSAPRGPRERGLCVLSRLPLRRTAGPTRPHLSARLARAGAGGVRVPPRRRLRAGRGPVAPGLLGRGGRRAGSSRHAAVHHAGGTSTRAPPASMPRPTASRRAERSRSSRGSASWTSGAESMVIPGSIPGSATRAGAARAAGSASIMRSPLRGSPTA